MHTTSSPGKKAGLAHWAARVLEECDKASAGFAADPVHDLRVAIRRCRSIADGFLSVDPDPAWKQMKRLAKPLFSSLGDLRDTQVMMEWVAKLFPPEDPLGRELSSALLQKESQLKQAAQQSLAKFDRKDWTALNAYVAARTGAIPIEGPVFQHLALERWMDARELHRLALRNRSGAAWHQLRIGIKRFRYTVENFLPQRHEKWSRDLRDLQDALGEVHDFDVLRALANSHPGIEAADRTRWQSRIAEERQARIDLYRRKMVGAGSLWQVWRAELPAGAELEAAGLEKLRTWAAFLDSDVQHSQLVTHLTLQLCDGLSQCGILNFKPRSPSIVEAAAFMHEVAASKADVPEPNLHPKRAQRKIAKLKPPIGWSEDEMRILAFLVRHHRGRLPAASESPFVGLDRKRREELMSLLGVLRLTTALDENHSGSVRDVTVSCKQGTVTVGCSGLRTMSREAEGVARARYLLETVCRRAIRIQAVALRRGGNTVAARSQERAASAT